MIQFHDRAFLPGREVIKDNVLGADHIMFNGMDDYVVNALVKRIDGKVQHRNSLPGTGSTSCDRCSQADRQRTDRRL